MKIYKNFRIQVQFQNMFPFYSFKSLFYSKNFQSPLKNFKSSLKRKNLFLRRLDFYRTSSSNLDTSLNSRCMCNATDISNLTVSRSADRLIIYIKTTFNNTLLTLTNEQGQVLTWASAGSCGFKGARKGTPFAAKKVVEIFIKKSTDYLYKCHQIKIYVCGVGPGRENALRGLEKIGYINPTTKQEKKLAAKKTTSPKTQFPKTTSKITSPTPLKALKFSNKIILIREITKIPHNGCRPPKKRRL